ncbi:N-methylhydantoinase A/oxoprolinase/acetone carboxylase, beta subunit [Dethiosulfatibacter aminovorans DSM 17477]|uniref:N-methylhydantoinase A/oxoprolinase/acetone carboxylase, beta subunit n=1 Tax=Dethiosulfatibacter aminovorans DSM 17477 TaxID=1121476 RepID=A0A1M6HT00_9FIRM|nr:hydantoinase/oxoprolinase family protein [Dethiosulfatibacter aminovorans]SHJ25325.1 N-methylhydantoinase A/oxoprolinase/acetone carboxylase, beta subunit [Dethiosulfatibacter aminovorans DSM 17477]
MAYILGIDTGGTYTDSVLYDKEKNKIIAKAKSLTTYENLVHGIKDSIDSLEIPEHLRVSGVSLSTTLATNAIVEGRGCEAGTILIGHEMIDTLPNKNCRVIGGGHDIYGNEKEPLDTDMLMKAVDELDRKVETFSVSSYFSVRNPEHELLAREFIYKRTGKPVVCGHELTSKLGFHERAVTASLNAKILPTIESLIKSVRKVLLEKNIKAPLMVVKGDGSLMDEETAMLKPIETILSGPASSIIGAKKLMDLKDALIVDIGGTTTDIALIRNNIPKIDMEGAKVGGWHTRVKSAKINTYGVGGDSIVRINSLEDIKIGPEKSIPFSEAGINCSYLADEIRDYYSGANVYRFNSIEGYKLVGKAKQLTDREKIIASALEKGPHTYNYLVSNLGNDFSRIYLNTLQKKGVIKLISLTPTDILHATEIYEQHDARTASAAVEIMAKELGTTKSALASRILHETVKKISKSIIESAMDYDGETFDKNEKNAKLFIEKMLKGNSESSSFDVSCSFKTPIVAIGAPVKAYMPQVSDLLNGQLYIPENADVANAIGAASGNVYEKISIVINSDGNGGAIMHSPWGREIFEDVESAKNAAVEKGTNHLMNTSLSTDITDVKIDKDIHDIYAGQSPNDEDNIFIESNIELSLTGKPAWN